MLEIGTGWGELAFEPRRGARVTSVTLSDEQAALARRRVQDAGMTRVIDVRVRTTAMSTASSMPSSVWR